MQYRVPLAYTSVGEEERAAVEAVFASGRLTQGQQVEEFERAFATQNGAKYAILVNSGSSANLIAIEAIYFDSLLQQELTKGPLKQGDEVIIQGLSWPTTLTPLLNHGLQPVFCDIDLQSLNATVDTVKAVRTKATRAVIAVPVLGNPEGLEELRDYCESEGLLLIEDACESLGAHSARGNLVGTFGLASSFSFYFSHHMTTVEGGAILTDSREIADLCYALRSHGWTRHLKLGAIATPESDANIDPRFCFILPGYNVRASEVTAALGKVQLKRLPVMLERRRSIAKGRIAALQSSANSVTVPGAAVQERHSWMTLPLLFGSRARKVAAQSFLEEAGVETRPIIVGNILRHPLARMIRLKSDQPDLPACDEVFARGIMIGLNPMSTDTDENFLHRTLNDAARCGA